MTTLVTGGAGYIGAHVVRLLQEAGEHVVVVDDLSTGAADRIGDATLIELDVASPGAVEVLTTAMRDHDVDAVIHFAARKQVGESVLRPTFYYAQNVGGLTQVIDAMVAAGVEKLVFSSSAATYGSPEESVVSETARTAPINPYGETKLIGEWLGRDAERAHGIKFVALRYFNVAGSGWDDLGDPAVLNLVPMVLERVTQGQPARLFGEDYDTPDGTCIRDYVHVADLADAHIASLDYLDRVDREFDVFNVGSGAGASVREVIDAIARHTELPVTVDVEPRRAGDPALLVASPERIEQAMGWRTSRTFDDIIASAWSAWQAGPRAVELD